MLLSAFNFVRHTTCGIIITSLLISTYPTNSYSQNFRSCASEDENLLLEALRERALISYQEAHNEFDYEIATINAWRDAHVTEIIAIESEKAGAEVGDESGFVFQRLKKLGTGIMPSQAKKAATEIASKTFEGRAFNNGIEKVVEGVSQRFVNHLSIYTEDVAKSLGSCFTDFLSTNYAPIIQSAATDFMVEMEPDIGNPSESIGTGGINKDAVVGVVSGVMVAVVATLRRQLIRRITGNIMGRIVGRLAAYAVPYAGWLYAFYEIATSWNGSIPTIIENINDSSSIRQIQRDISSEIEQAVELEVPGISKDIVDASMSSWNHFVKSNELILSIAQTNPRFDRYLRQFSRDEDFSPVREAVSLIVKLGGEATLEEMIDKGQIADVLQLRPSAKNIARDLSNVRAAIEWQDLVGVKVDTVYSSNLHKYHTSPSSLSDININFLINHSDYSNFPALASLPESSITLLRSIDQNSLGILLDNHRAINIESISESISRVANDSARNRIWRNINSDRFKANHIENDVFIIANSNDQDLSSRIVFSSTINKLNPLFLSNVFGALVDGRISKDIIRTHFIYVFAVLILICFVLILFLLKLMRSLLRKKSSEVV